MSWSSWPTAGVAPPTVVQGPVINSAPNVANPAAAAAASSMVAQSQYTTEQWAQVQQHNWQQWAQWQQQFQQWQQQYGAEYQKSMSAMAQARGTPAQTAVPYYTMPTATQPPLPIDSKPPPPPDDSHGAPAQQSQSAQQVTQQFQHQQFQQQPPLPPTAAPSANVTSVYPATQYSQPPPLIPSGYTTAPPPPQTAPPQEQYQYTQNQQQSGALSKNQSGFENRNTTEDNQKFGRNQNFPSNKNNSNWQNQGNRSQGPNKRPFNQQQNERGDMKRNRLDNQPEGNKWHGGGNQRSQKWNDSGNDQRNQRWGEQTPEQHNQNFDEANNQRNRWGSDNKQQTKPVRPPAKLNPDEPSEAEKKFDKQFGEWEAQFQKWKAQNAHHPDTSQYQEYEKKWVTWRAQLLERREQMRRKRLGLTGDAPKATPQKSSSTPSLEESNSFVEHQRDYNQAKQYGGNAASQVGPRGIPPLLQNPASQIGPQGIPPLLQNSAPPPLLQNSSPQIGPQVIPPLLQNPPPQIGSKAIPPLLQSSTPQTGSQTIPPLLQNPSPPIGTQEVAAVVSEPTEKQSLSPFNEPENENNEADETVEDLPPQDNTEEVSQTDDNSSTGFLKTTTADGIPGLDLAKEGDEKSEDSKELPVPVEEEKKKPDLEAISRGINSILGDQNLMNMLSLVSQAQPSQSTVTSTQNTTVQSSSPKFSPAEYVSNIEHDQGNFDDQTRSSFNAINESENFTRLNEGENASFDCKSFNLESDSRQGFSGGPNNQGAFNKGFNDFNRNDAFNRGSDNYLNTNENRGPNNFTRADNFNSADNFNRGHNFNQGSDNFNRGFDNSRGQDSFNQGSDNLKRDQDNFNRDQDNFNRDQDNLNRSSDKFGGKPTNPTKGPPSLFDLDFSKGLGNFNRGSGNFGKGSDSFNRGNDNLNRGSSEFDRNWESDNSRDDFRGGPGSFNRRGGGSMGRGGQENFNRGGSNNFNRGGSNNNRRGYNNFNQGRNDFFEDGNDGDEEDYNFQRGGDNFSRGGADNFDRGNDNFNRGGFDNFNRGRDGLNRGSSDNFQRDRFNRGSDSFLDEEDNSYEPQNFNRPANDFDPGPDNFKNDIQLGKRGPNTIDAIGSKDLIPSARDSKNFHPNKGNEGNKEPLLNWSNPNVLSSESSAPPEKEEKEEGIWKACSVVEYDHKPLKPVEPDVLLVPLNMFDYRHKLLSRIPFPQRPKWLSDVVKNFPEFDPPIARQIEPQLRFSEEPNISSRRYDDRDRKGFDNWDRKSFDDRDRKPFDDRDRKPFDDRDRKPFDDRDRKPFDDRDRKPFDDRDRNFFDDRNRKPFDSRDRKLFDDQDRQFFDDRDPKPFDDRDRKSVDDRNRKPFDRDRNPFDDRERKSFDDRERKSFDDRDRKFGDDRDKKFGDDRDRKFTDDRDRKFTDDRDRKFTNDRDRKITDDRDKRGADDRDRRGADDRDRKFTDDRDKRGADDRDRRGADDRDRKSFDERDRKSYNDDRKDRKYEDRDRKSYDDRDRKRFDERDRKSYSNYDLTDFEENRGFGSKLSNETSDDFPDVSSKRSSNSGKSEEPENIFTNKTVNIEPSVLDNNKLGSGKTNVTLIEELLCAPGRLSRPPRIVIILRGPPGSGKSHLAKVIKDKEVDNGGSAPRIICLDDYFMVEQDKEIEEDGKKVKVKEMVYEYEECMEASYRQSLMKSFKKTITDGYFTFIIVDNINDKVKYFGEMWSFAKQNGFQVYICEMDLDVQACTKRNIHGRSEIEIERCVAGWEPTPSHHPILDASSLLLSDNIAEVDMEEVNSTSSVEAQMEEHIASKWDSFDYSVDNLAKLDGTNKPLRPSKTMEDYLYLDEWSEPVQTKPGQKRVRWADLEEHKKQEKMRAIGFVVGQTNWDRMMDPTKGSSALTQTKYIERYK